MRSMTSSLCRISLGLRALASVRPVVAAVVAGLAVAGWGLGARGDESPDAGSGSTAPPPGVIVDEGAAEPIAPDPESLYIRLLAANADSPVPAPRSEREPVDAALSLDGSGTPEEGRKAGAGGDDREPADGTVEARPATEVKQAKERQESQKESKKSACEEQSKECRDALRRLRDDALSDIALDIRVGGRPGSDYPCECRLEGETFQPRRFATTMMTWKAAGNCHKPLYFEDWSLERYGHSHGPLADPFFSAAHFFVTLPVLPYKMGVELPWECVYPLGYYRPGSCAPWTIPAVPMSCRGFAVQAATVTGIVFALP